MSKTKELNEIAQDIADVTIELMSDSVSWQLSHLDEDGDDYDAIHADVMFRAMAEMYKSLQNYKMRYHERQSN